MENKRSVIRVVLAMGGMIFLSNSHADAPLVWEWVTLDVQSCQAATFEAPPYESTTYVRNEAYRTAVIRGRVVEAGLRPYNASDEHVRRWAEQASQRLPKPGADLQVAMPEWNAEVCKAVHGKVQKFNYNYGCDTLPRRQQCLVPLRLVEISP